MDSTPLLSYLSDERKKKIADAFSYELDKTFFLTLSKQKDFQLY